MRLLSFLLSFLVISSVFGHLQHPGHFQSDPSDSLDFEKNMGQIRDQNDQVRSDILFAVETGGLVCHLRDNGLAYTLHKVLSWKEPSFSSQASYPHKGRVPDQIGLYRVDVQWLGANRNIEIVTDKQLHGIKNYYNVPEGQTPVLGVKSYNEIKYQNIYNNIDLHFYESEEGAMEYDFIVAPGGDYEQIRIEIKGADLEVSNNNELILKTPYGRIVEGPLKVFQAGREIKSNWRIEGNIVSFEVEDYDPSEILRIDPRVRVWGTYYAHDNGINKMILDQKENIFAIGGFPTSATVSLATTGAHQTIRGGGTDAFFAKFSPNGTPQWCTYYGGSGNDIASGLCGPDSAGNIYFSGTTKSPNNIATFGSHSSFFQGTNPYYYADAYLVKFDSLGIRKWGSYYGGASIELSVNCAMDHNGNLLLIGSTFSTFGIATPGSWRPTKGGFSDVFLAKFDSSGTRLWGTYYGGNNGGEAISCTTDKNGNVFIAGNTSSTNGIASTGAHKSAYSGTQGDAFLAKFDSIGNRSWGTYFGGDALDRVNECFTDSAGSIYLTGRTESSTQIASVNSYQDTLKGFSDAFITKFGPTGNWLWGSYLGGDSIEEAYTGIADHHGNIFFSGLTQSISSLATSNAHQTNYGGGTGDVFVAHFDKLGAAHSISYYGGSNYDYVSTCAIGRGKHLYIAGTTKSSNNIASPGAPSTSFSGPNAAYIAKLQYCTNTTSQITINACDSLRSPSGINTWFTSGMYVDTLISEAGCDSILNINLRVSHPTSDTISMSTCDRMLSPSGKYLWNTSGRYIDTISSSSGCDSILAIDLNIINSNIDSLAFSTCNAFTSPSGQYNWQSSGNYIDTLKNQMGCDSILYIDLTITVFDTSLTQNGITLTSNAQGTNYQWLDCSKGFDPISGETGQSFTAIKNGSYAVLLSDSLCSDTSQCATIANISNGNELVSSSLRIFPNPAQNFVVVSFTNVSSEIAIRVLDFTGRTIFFQTRPNTGRVELNLNGVAPGAYLIEVTSKDERFTRKLLKQ